MESRFFIEDRDLVKKLLRKLTPTNEHTGYECELYIDKDTGQKWEKYLFEDPTGSDGIGFRKFPYPETEETINIALTSPYLDEVDGASALLIHREYYYVKFREQLISAIEKNIKEISKERFEIIYYRAELNDITNRNEIFGKHYKEIKEDAKHYQRMMARAEEIKRVITDNK